jgi:hypothetical protein
VKAGEGSESEPLELSGKVCCELLIAAIALWAFLTSCFDFALRFWNQFCRDVLAHARQHASHLICTHIYFVERDVQ